MLLFTTDSILYLTSPFDYLAQQKPHISFSYTFASVFAHLTTATADFVHIGSVKKTREMAYSYPG